MVGAMVGASSYLSHPWHLFRPVASEHVSGDVSIRGNQIYPLLPFLHYRMVALVPPPLGTNGQKKHYFSDPITDQDDTSSFPIPTTSVSHLHQNHSFHFGRILSSRSPFQPANSPQNTGERERAPVSGWMRDGWHQVTSGGATPKTHSWSGIWARAPLGGRGGERRVEHMTSWSRWRRRRLGGS